MSPLPTDGCFYQQEPPSRLFADCGQRITNSVLSCCAQRPNLARPTLPSRSIRSAICVSKTLEVGLKLSDSTTNTGCISEPSLIGRLSCRILGVSVARTVCSLVPSPLPAARSGPFAELWPRAPNTGLAPFLRNSPKADGVHYFLIDLTHFIFNNVHRTRDWSSLANSARSLSLRVGATRVLLVRYREWAPAAKRFLFDTTRSSSSSLD